MFASVTKREVKFGDDFVVIKKLSGYQLTLARDEKQAVNVGNLRRLGGELLTAIQSSQVEQAAENLRKKTGEDERYAEYDRMTVLKYGIVNWSAGEVTNERLRDLEEDVAQKVFQEIIDLTLPSKVQADQQEEKD